MKRNFILTTLLLLILAVVPMFAGGQQEAQAVPSEATVTGPQYGGVLRIGLSEELTCLGYPGRLATSWDSIYATPAVETLCRYDEEGILLPWLCESYEADSEKLTLTVKLRDGIMFHDGTPLDSAAVKWNWEEFKASGRNEINTITSIETPDDLTVVAHMSSWDNTLAEYALYVGGWMVSPTFVKAVGVDAAMAKPVGTGPFKFVEWERESRLVYEKNENYWREGEPYLDGITFFFLMDDSTMTSAFRSGEIDISFSSNRDFVDAMFASGLESISRPLNSGIPVYFMIFDSTAEDAATSDILVRKAFNHAVDMDAIINIMGGPNLLVKTNQWAATSSWSYNPDTVGYPYNPDKARELLAEAGYAEGECSIDLVYVPYGTNPDVAAALQEMLAQVGIKGVPVPIDQTRSNEMSGIGGHWNGVFISAGRCDPDVGPIYARTFTDQGVRYVGGTLHPEELAVLIEKAKSAKTFEEKRKYSQEMSRLIIDDYCLVAPISTPISPIFAQDYVHETHKNYYHFVLWTPESAYLSK